MDCRWGILSTAGIARKNWRAIAKTKAGRVTAVASRQVEAAQKFIDECQAHTPQRGDVAALGSYDELLDRDDVDAVYIPLPTGMRKSWIIKAAEKGKHILAEKPAALNASDLEEILEVCRKNHVQFMDGVMFMHSERLPLLRSHLDSSEGIGNLRRTACHFSFLGDEAFRTSNIRVDSRYEPHGCLGDLGWYCIRFLLWANQWKMPREVSGRTLTTLKGKESIDSVPAEFSAELLFDDGSSGSFYCSFVTNHQQWAHMSGDNGYVVLNDFVLPFYGSESSFESGKPEFTVDGCDFHMHRHSKRYAVSEYASGHTPAQEINMFETFHKIVQSKQLDPFWGNISLATQRVLDQLFVGS